MKQKLSFPFTALALLAGVHSLGAQGTAFTYEGHLNDGGAPANGLYDIRASVWTAQSGGTMLSAYDTNSAVAVSNGLFMVLIDFGPGVFTGATDWLQIGVRSNGTAVDFSALSPREQLTPTPYAIFAEGADAAGLSGTIPQGSLSGAYGSAVNFTNPADSFAGNGAGLANVNAATLSGLGSSNFWQLSGNIAGSGAFLGTINNQLLELRVNNTRAMQYRLDTDPFGVYSNAPNVIGGSGVNFMAGGVVGGTIGGGGGNDTKGNSYGNRMQSDFGVIAGGLANTDIGFAATVAGGSSNSIPPGAAYSFIGGGANNSAIGGSAAVGGGEGNIAGGLGSFIGGGGFDGARVLGNLAQGNAATIGGGLGNNIPSTASYATVGGGYRNAANGPGSFVGGGGFDGNTADSGGNNASGAASVIGGGLNNTNSGYASTIGGGSLNTAASTTSGFFYGGATVSGGEANKAGTDFATVAGGLFNSASGPYSTVAGGSLNTAGGIGSFAAGQNAQTTHNGTFIWGDGSQTFNGENVDNGFNVLATGGVFFYNGTNGLHVDGLGNNNGTIDYALRFGGAISSGEGIASKRTAGGNQYGLDFYTSSNDRLSIDVNGHVGINTTTPAERLEVNGDYVLIDGHNANNGNGPIDAYIGGNGSGSDVQIGSMNSLITSIGFWNTAAAAWMHIACSSITINGGADVAEPFPMSTTADEITPGAVVVIDAANPGRLKLSEQAYDPRVAGVVSGANGINPGIQMQQQGLLAGGRNVALTGRVYVQADTSNGAIQPGDLLTTSALPGRAMKVTNHAKAQGAILGKAMTSLDKGNGMVLVLVTLQ